MPFGGKPHPDDRIELIRRWIRKGANNDSTDQTIETVPAGPVALAISPDGQTWPPDQPQL